MRGSAHVADTGAISSQMPNPLNCGSQTACSQGMLASVRMLRLSASSLHTPDMAVLAAIDIRNCKQLATEWPLPASSAARVCKLLAHARYQPLCRRG